MRANTSITQILQASFSIAISQSTSVLSVSDGIYSLLGFYVDDFLSGKVTLQSRIHPDDQDIADALFSNDVNPISSSFNIRLRQADGHIRCVKGQYTKTINNEEKYVTLEILLQDAKSLWEEQGDQTMMANFKAMMDNTDDYIYFKDSNHVFTGASKTLVDITEPSEHWMDLIGKTDYDVFPEAFADIYYSLEKRVFVGVDVAHEEQETLDGDGNKGWVDNRKYPIKNDAGEIVGLFGIARDITQRKQIEISLQISEHRLLLSQESGGVGTWEYDFNTNKSFCSRNVYQQLKFPWSSESSSWDDVFSAIFPEDHAHVNEVINLHISEGTDLDVEYRITDTEGDVRWMRTIGQVNCDSAGNPVSMQGTVQDITKGKLAEHDLSIAATAFESQEGMMVTDSNKVLIRVNEAFTTITGYDSEEAIGNNPSLLASGRHDAVFYEEMWQAINTADYWSGEVWNKRKDGEVYPEKLTITAVRDSKGILTNYVGTITDITLSKQAEQEIEDLAYYDPLTHLPNRRLMIDRIHHAMAASARSGNQCALLFLDLDHFKDLNDTLGHDMGDLLLQQVAERLTSCIREGDTNSRFGGDEFVVLLEELSVQPVEAATQAEGIANKILSSINKPYQLASHNYSSSTSIGITVFDAHKSEAEELLKQADIALYKAKDDGRNALRFYDPQMQATITARAELEKELILAVDQHQFQLHYQVQMDNLQNPIGAEALIRWNHPKRGLVSPIDFIPLAEQNGTILAIGQWVLDTACAQLKAWQHDVLTRVLTLSVNVSAKQFHQVDFISQVIMSIEQHGVNPAHLKLELTESLLLDNIEDTIAKIESLTEMGIHFSLDDFGTGYSSLQYLKKLPLYQLKIDKSFVDNLVTDSNDQVIVRTIIVMAYSLGLTVIAEGVETKEQQQLLLEEGCTHYQGYLYSKPVSIVEFEALLRKS